MSRLTELIVSDDPATRNRSMAAACADLTLAELLRERDALEAFRRTAEGLYDRVRALCFLYALHRFHLPNRPALPVAGKLPFTAVDRLLHRRFDEAIRLFRAAESQEGPNDAICSGLAEAYHALAFQTLADQVRRSVRGIAGNRWMFRIGASADYPLRVRSLLTTRSDPGQPFPMLRERTPVRMDLSHSAWSDIFFLGMDYPEGARVLNVSVDLGVRGRDERTRPPIEATFRVIDEPVLRLVSIDLNAAADIRSLDEVFDFARDHLGLLKAAVIAAGLIPPGMEGSHESVADVFAVLVGPGRGIELVSSVNGIPKGSRLAVSTNLLSALIAVCMRATGQSLDLTGPLREADRRLVAARAILGEWLGGSGGGWQDSGGVWPAIKLIEGAAACEGDPEFGSSRGRVLPTHTVLGPDRVSADARRRLEESLVLVHGGMAQNVGPVLEMVTEKYLLREEREWEARQQALGYFTEILRALEQGDIRKLGLGTTGNFTGPIQAIIPAATNAFTEALIAAVRDRFAADFWGFVMLGGMSGGGMGFLVAPQRKQEAQAFLQATMSHLRGELRSRLPFAMEPVVYDFAVNPVGTTCDLLQGDDAIMPAGYYSQQLPTWLRDDPRLVPASRRGELERVGAAARVSPEHSGLIESLFDRMLPHQPRSAADRRDELKRLLAANGFDREQHERIRVDLRRGLIGLAQNRLPVSTVIEDVERGDVVLATEAADAATLARGRASLAAGEVAIVTLAGGAGTRWTQGAGVVKALHPFARLSGRHRNFLDIHRAKARRTGVDVGATPLHVVTTGYLTHAPIAAYLESLPAAETDSVVLSRGSAVGLRLVPMERDLRFLWEATAQQVQDERKQKMRESIHAALIEWARSAGEGSDYTDNEPLQCLHPVGHWAEVANLLRNGVLRELLARRPQLQHLLVHNIDTLGANLDPGLLGRHLAGGNALTFEVITRRIEDRGGGLARVNGRVRILEGLALPREEAEFDLTYYNSLTTWVSIDGLLDAFGLTRGDLADPAATAAAVARIARRLPTYVTLKDVKRRWGQGQEDVFPVCQFEQLWGDMTALPGLRCGYLAVPRVRGQQLKNPAQLDGWLRDGSADDVVARCDFGDPLA